MENRTRDAIRSHLLVHRAIVQVDNIIDCAGVVDVVRSYLRRIGRSGRLSIRNLPAKVVVPQPAGRRILGGVEYLLAKILVADSRMEVMPCGMLWIGGWMQRIETDMAEAARHTDQIWRLDLCRIGKIFIQIPRLRIKLGIPESSQANDSGRLSYRTLYVLAIAYVQP